MATWPAKINYTTGGILTAAQMNDIGGELNDLYTDLNHRNPVLNSAMQIWQRGTSIAIAATKTYGADRYYGFRGAATTGQTVSRQTTSDTTNLPNIQYCQRVQRDSGNTSTQYLAIAQDFETINSIPYIGKTITFSFYARAGANYSSASSALTLKVKTGTGTDQSIFTGYTNETDIINQTATLTTTWQRFTYSASLGSTATQLGFLFQYTPVGTAGANDYFEVTGVQIDLGSVAMPFRTYGGTIQGELAACQRYYWRFSVSNVQSMGLGWAVDANTAQIIIAHPVNMRTSPTALEQSGTAADYTLATAAGVQTCTAVPTFTLANPYNATVTMTATGLLTAGQGLRARNANANGYLGWSAEL